MEGQLSWADWRFEPTVTAGLFALVVLYGAAMGRGWVATDDDVRPWFASAMLRPLCFGLGIGSALVALCSPLDRGGDDYLFALHMVQHLMLMMVAPPLLLLGIAGARRLGEWGNTAPRFVHLAWSAATRTWPAAALFSVVLVIWHVPALYDATLTVEPIHVFEHLTFVAAGAIFWWPIVDPLRTPDDGHGSAMQKVAMLTVAGLPPTALGFVFALAHHPIYGFYARAPRLWGMSPVTDQQVAGVIMFGAGNLIYFIAISVVFLRMFGSGEHDERGAGRVSAVS